MIFRRADGLQQEFVPLVRPGRERKGMPGNHERGLRRRNAAQIRALGWSGSDAARRLALCREADFVVERAGAMR